MSSAPQAPSKKKYQKPRLKVYGDIEALTAAVGVSGMSDGGSFGMIRTH